MDTIGCGHMVQPGRNEEADWSLKLHMLNRTRCACFVISVQRDLYWQSECASPIQVGVDISYKSKGETLLKYVLLRSRGYLGQQQRIHRRYALRIGE